MTQISGKARAVRGNIVFTLALVLACAVAWLVRDVLTLLFVSALFAVVLTPVVQFTAQLRIGRRQPFKNTAVYILILAMALALVVFCFLALPPVIRDMEAFIREMPVRLPERLEKLKQLPFAGDLNTQEISSRLQNFLSNAATYLFLSIRDWVGAVMNIATCFILTVYFILGGDQVYAWFLSFFPLGSRERLDKTLRRAELRMGKWLIGQGSLMLILGVLSTIVYVSLHVRYAFALGVLTGAMNIIPVLGAAICVALALLVAAVDSWGRVLGVGVFYLIYLQVENSYLTPRIMEKSVGLPGLAILVALLLGSAIGGIAGALVSVPTAVLVGELVNEYLVQKSPE